MLIDGTIFDSSVYRGHPEEFTLDQLIGGWAEALQLMQAGDQWRLFIPPELGNGEVGFSPAIPPNVT